MINVTFFIIQLDKIIFGGITHAPALILIEQFRPIAKTYQTQKFNRFKRLD